MVLTDADTARLERVAVAVEALQAAGITVDGLEVDLATVDVNALIAGIAGAKTVEDLWDKTSADQATQTTLAAILAKIIAAPATEAKQDTINTSIGTRALETGGNLADIKTAVEIIDNNVLASKTLLRARFNASVANGAYLEIAPDPAAATSIKIVELSITQTVQGLTSIWTETGGTPVQEAAEWYFPAYGGICLQMSQQPHIVASQANENIGLKNETGATCLYSGHVVYYLE